jgi:hypothetical protein
MKFFWVAAALFMLGFGASMAQASAQITLQNNTKYQLSLYIDNNFGCGPALPRGFCTSSVTAGPHLLEARKGEEVVQKEEAVNIGEGTSPVWTVTIEDDSPLEGKWMVQSSWEPNEVGKYWTITRSGDSYSVSHATAGTCPRRFYRGGPTEFTTSFTPDYACLYAMYIGNEPDDAFASVLQRIAGQVTVNERFTLSSDGKTLTWAIDYVNIHWVLKSGPPAAPPGEQVGVFTRLEIRPFANKTTLVRVSLR